MFRFDRIGTPRIHGSNLTMGSSTSAVVNSNATSAGAFTGHAINSVPGSISGRDQFFWDQSLTLPISHKVFVGQQFSLTKKQADNSQGLELSGSLFTNCNEAMDITPFFARLVSAGGGVLAAVSLAENPSFLLPEGTSRGSSVTMRSRALSYAEPVNVIADDLGFTFIHGFLFSLRDAAAGTMDRMMMRFGFRTGEPDPAVKDYDIRR